MSVDFYATREWYVDHLAPIWKALPDHQRGTFYVAPRETMAERLRSYGIRGEFGQPRLPARPVVVAGGNELAGLRRPILVEHGAGQTYRDVSHESWAGGPGRDRCLLFVVPNGTAAAANLDRYPHTPNVIASPRVEALQKILPGGPGRVVFGRHWDSYLCPELQSAWPHYFGTIRDYCREFPERAALHFHPRAADVGRTLAAEWGVPYYDRFEKVIHGAHVFVIDNSSSGYEAAACGISVLWYNSPDWRRRVEHGLRFWSLPANVQVDTPDELRFRLSLGYVPKTPTADVYPTVEGSAARAAAAILEFA